MEIKPDIELIKDSSELRRWYWKKTELMAKAKQLGVRVTGAKFALLDRIANIMDGTSETILIRHTKSQFKWDTELLTDSTIITDNYKNTQNVRKFMSSRIHSFKFTIDFMQWMKSNVGKTLADAVIYYTEKQQQMKSGKFTPQIEKHNQLNQYFQNFFKENPHLSIKDARICWRYKTSLPSNDGLHKYEKEDLKVLNR